MRAVRQIDKALKSLYNIETTLCAEQFLIHQFPAIPLNRAGSGDFEGALYIQEKSQDRQKGEVTIDLGIYLSPGVRDQLESFTKWKNPWTLEQLKAFSVASEEVSHFHYLLFNLMRNRPISEFELELQGEIDRFLILFFSKPFGEKSSKIIFDEVYEQLFCNFSFAKRLTVAQRQRYEDASIYAKRFFQKMRASFSEKSKWHLVLKRARIFYQMDLNHKIAFLHQAKS